MPRNTGRVQPQSLTRCHPRRLNCHRRAQPLRAHPRCVTTGIRGASACQACPSRCYPHSRFAPRPRLRWRGDARACKTTARHSVAAALLHGSSRFACRDMRGPATSNAESRFVAVPQLPSLPAAEIMGRSGAITERSHRSDAPHDVPRRTTLQDVLATPRSHHPDRLPIPLERGRVINAGTGAPAPFPRTARPRPASAPAPALAGRPISLLRPPTERRFSHRLRAPSPAPQAASSSPRLRGAPRCPPSRPSRPRAPRSLAGAPATPRQTSSLSPRRCIPPHTHTRARASDLTF